ncbi:Uncharacterized protein PCOAH_00054180 [Plasmodium coatneyi]|uniref:RAP domain-containing protein n=1 Tax=Plasmodium coatneyi TaxID=208452 RepID=A0A1B1E7Q2_9APIC|nr:Uncharacterized protein PCOAH_00054180 [Plasmodium coatneyi]ANQ11028.1 Uncharacterized protein PCOAH_00054180 [Plasmodium coatneyi]
MLQRYGGSSALLSPHLVCRRRGVVYRIRVSLVHQQQRQHNSCSNTRHRKIVVIPFSQKDQTLHYKNIPFCVELLDRKSKKDLLQIYKTVRRKDERKNLPSDFFENLFLCTRKFVRSLLPHEFVRIYKTMVVVGKKDRELNLLMHQQMKRIHANFDVTSISKLFQLFTFAKSKPVHLVKMLAETFLRRLQGESAHHVDSIKSAKSVQLAGSTQLDESDEPAVLPWHVRELVAIFCFFRIDSKKHIKSIFHHCTPWIGKNVQKFTPKDVTIILYSTVHLGRQDPIILSAVVKHIAFKGDSFQFFQLAIILNCFAKLGEKNNKLCKVVCDQVKRRMRGVPSPGVATECAPPDEVVEIGSTGVEAECVANVQGSASAKEPSGYAVRQNRGNCTSGGYPQPKDVSILLNALIRLEHYDNATFNCLIPFIVNHASKFSPQSLSNLVHAYSQMQIKNTLMLEKLSEECILKMKKFKNIEMSNLASSLVRLNVKNKILFTYLIDEFLYRATIGVKYKSYQFDVVSLQQLAYSFSKVGLSDEKVYVVLHRLLLRRIGQLRKNGNKSIQAAALVGGSKDEPSHGQSHGQSNEQFNERASSCEDGIARRGPQFDFLCLSTFVNSYAAAKMKPKHLFHFISYIIREKKKKKEILSNQSLCCLVYGLAKLELPDRKIHQVLLKEGTERVDTLKPFQAVLLLYSYSKLRIYSRMFVKKAVQLCSRNIHQLTLADLTLACYSLSNLLYRDVIFLYKVSKVILLNNFQFEKTNVCQLFNSFTKLCFFYKPIYQLVFQRMLVCMHDLGEKELANVALSFAYYFHTVRLCLCEGATEEQEGKQKEKQVEKRSQEKQETKRSDVRQETKQSECHLVQSHPELFFRNELSIFFNLIFLLNEKHRQKMSIISIQQLQVVDLYLRAFFPKYCDFPGFVRTFFVKVRSVKLRIDDYLIMSSKTHRNVSRFLSLVGVAHRSEVQFGPYQLDIVVDFLQDRKKMRGFFPSGANSNVEDHRNVEDHPNVEIIYKTKRLEGENLLSKSSDSEIANACNVVEKKIKKNILVEVDGVSHFYKESHSRTINSIIKNFILQKCGWHIIHVPYQEWNQCVDFKKKVLYAVQVLRYILRINREDISVGDFLHLLGDHPPVQGQTYRTANVVRTPDREEHATSVEAETITSNYGEVKNEPDRKDIPHFYTISEEELFRNQTKNRSRHQKGLMEKMRQDNQLSYHFNVARQAGGGDGDAIANGTDELSPCVGTQT